MPISFHYTMIINFLLLVLVKFGYNSKTVVTDKNSIIILFLLLLYCFILLFIRTGSLGLELSVGYIYFLLCAISYPYILDFFINKKVDLLPVISVVLVIHCIIIILEVIFPELQVLISYYVDYGRDDIDRFLFMDYRKMGLAASFDTSGFWASLSTILSFLLFFSRGKLFYLLIFLISAASSLATSRTGMVVSFLSIILIVFFFKDDSKNKTRTKLIKIVSIVAIAFVGANVLLPILSSETGVQMQSSDYISDIQDSYTEGSARGVLGGRHWDVLKNLSADELIFGTGRILRKVQSLSGSSDVGYVRHIFQIGLIGLMTMLLAMFNNWKRVHRKYRILKKKGNSKSVSMIYLFYILVFISLLIMHFKNMFLFAKGQFEMYYLAYFILLHYLYRGSVNDNNHTKQISR